MGPVATTLSPEQVDAILVEALNRGLFEADVDGNLPADPKERLAAAATLVVMADQAFKAGSRDNDVAAVLFIAGVDMQPPIEGDDVPSDMETFSDDMVVKIERSLSRVEDEDVSAELADARAELERRGLTPTPAATEGNGHAAEAPAPEPEPEPAPRRDILAETHRKVLEDQLTVAIMRAHSIDPSEISQLSIEALEWVIAHPEPTTPEPAAEEPPEIAAANAPDPDRIETMQIVPASPPAPVVVEERTTILPDVSPERDALESEVTGPMLKAYGRGRLDVPGLGDNELAFMVANPEGRVTAEALAAAQALDESSVIDAHALANAIAAAHPAAQTTVTPEPTSSVQTTVEEAIAEEEAAAAPDAAFAPPAPEESAPAPAAVVKPPPPVHIPPEAERDAAAHFADIVKREHLPEPPEINEDPPILPFDMSKCTKEELYSLHARFHACESRMAYVVSQEEDSLGDLEKMRKGRETELANEIPMTVDRKKLTEAQRAAIIASDPQVQTYQTAIHNVEKTLRKLKVLRDSYHRDVERTSRQMTRFAKEFEGA